MEDIQLLEAVLAGVLRKYVPTNRKIDIDLVKVYNETDLDINVNEDGIAKISWSAVDATIE